MCGTTGGMFTHPWWPFSFLSHSWPQLWLYLSGRLSDNPMIKEILIFIPTLVFSVSIAVFLVWIIALALTQIEERHLKNYEDCKVRTTDIEWCVKITKPNLWQHQHKKKQKKQCRPSNPLAKTTNH